MQNSSFNFASVFAIMVLLVFSYITFLGLAYWQEGDLILPMALSLGLIVVVSFCIYVMCWAKANWNRKVLQIILGLIALIIFLLASRPFSNFINVLNQSDTIKAKMTTMYEAAINLDDAYAEYVSSRISNYKKRLSYVSEMKNVRPSDYQKYLGGAAGANDKARIENLSKSLYSKLMPDSTAKIVRERHKWLIEASNTSVWNPLAAANINKIGEEVDDWKENYRKLSSVIYDGEDAKEFNGNESNFNNEFSGLMQIYNGFHAPSAFAMIISLVCFTIMMLPYFVTPVDLRGNGEDDD